MTTTSQLESIFFAALEKPLAERTAFLEEACGGDADLRCQLERMLAAQVEADRFLEQPAFGGDATVLHEPAIAEQPGSVIGPYKLLQQIGEGGMGVVFMAEQEKPVQRTVALKIIKPGMDTRQVIARFEAERQALAMMDHPNIAKVLDAGTTGGEPGGVSPGRPFFVMELVKGVPITEYCDQQHLSIRERLQLFTQVCQAVQHAHQKGIIHRDLKPSNVLVAEYDGRPVPKIIDFGVAKATAQKLTEKTMFTEYGQLIGTFEYMSPEQARFNQLDVDTRSDIYSLGVLLYELLAGSTPLEKERLRSAAFDEILRMIGEEEPPKPSTRLSSSATLPTIAASRQTDAARLSREVSGELDWIVMKCLEKDRNRRYETVSGLATDIGLYLQDEPVQACPPSAVYKFRKFARRNRTALTLAAMGLALLVALGVVASWMARDRAARNAALEQGVNSALAQFSSSFQSENWSEATAALNHAESLLAAGNAPLSLQMQVTGWHSDLDRILRLDQIVLESAGGSQGEQWQESVKAHEAFEKEFRSLGIDVDSLSVKEAADRIRPLRISEHLRRALDEWANYRMDLIYGSIPEKWDKPASWAKRPLAIAALAGGDDFQRRVRQADERFDMAAVVSLVEQPAARNLPGSLLRILARDLYWDGQPGHRKLAVEILARAQVSHPSDFWINYSMANYLRQLQPPADAEAIRYWSVALARRPQSSRVRLALATALSHSGRLDEAVVNFQQAIELQPDYGYAYNNLANALKNQGQFDEAYVAATRAIELMPHDSYPYNTLGLVLNKLGRLDEAATAFRKAIEFQPIFPEAYNNLGNLLQQQGKLDEAIAAHRTTIEQKPRNLALAYINLGDDLTLRGDFDEAIAANRKAIELQPNNAGAHAALGRVLQIQGKRSESDEAWREALELAKSADWFNDWAWTLATAPDPHHRDVSRAVELAEKAVKMAPQEANSWNTLGLARYRAGKWTEAVEAFNKSLEEQGDNGSNWLFLAMAHWQLGHKAEARDWYDKAACWIDKNHPKNQELIRFRAEAVELLGVAESKPSSNSATDHEQ